MRRTLVLGLLFLVSFINVAAADRDRDRRRPPPRVDWDSKGWTMLGEQTVQGRVDRDRINVGRDEGRFTKLTIVVLDSDLELLDFEVTFNRGSSWRPAVAHYFREGQRTRVIDMPGERGRTIRHIDIKYKNLPGGGRARVQVWGFASEGAPPPPPPKPRNYDWDNRGWTMLGEQTVQGRVDRDRIIVGRDEGKFTKLTIVVLDSDLELLDFEVTFNRGRSWRPAVAHYFREGQHTRVIDMPGERGRTIKHIDIKYKNLPGGGRARVQVWGFQTADAPPPPPPPPPRRNYDWDNRGWTMLGEQTVQGRVDRDRINVGRDEGKFTKLTIVVLDSDLELLDFEVTFNRGRSWRPAVAHYFREGQHTRVIDMPGERGRTIKHIDIKYKNLPGGGRARVQVWGFQTADAPPPPPPPRRNYDWDNRGWTMLGEQTVQGRVDRDRINVGRDEGKFTKLTIVVLDSDLELLDFEVTFNRGRSWRPAVAHYFREGQHTRVIDMPGERGRTIKHIDIKYKNLPGGGRARVQVWGFQTADAPPPPPPPPADAWVPLSEPQYNEDFRDFINVGADKGKFRRLRIDVSRGRVFVEQVAIEFTDGNKTQVVKLRREAGAGESFNIDLDGRERPIRRVIVYVDPAQGRRDRGVYRVFAR